MVTKSFDHSTLLAAVALADRAPSVHNTQPWRWYSGDRTLHLYADLRRWLPATDHDGRDLVVSCGAVLHHARMALSAAGIRNRVHRLPNADEPDHLAAIELGTGNNPDTDLTLASAIPARRTDRRPFGTWPVPPTYVAELIDAAAAEGAVLRRVDSVGGQRRLMSAIRDAEAAQNSDPRYAVETALWSGRSAGTDGIPSTNLPNRAADPCGAARRFADGDIKSSGHHTDGAELLVIGTTSDDTLSRLRAGEALSAVLLHATELGLATCPLSQPLEVDTTHRLVRDQILAGSLCPQIIIRVGWAPTGRQLPSTPRRPPADTLARLPIEPEFRRLPSDAS